MIMNVPLQILKSQVNSKKATFTELQKTDEEPFSPSVKKKIDPLFENETRRKQKEIYQHFMDEIKVNNTIQEIDAGTRAKLDLQQKIIQLKQQYGRLLDDLRVKNQTTEDTLRKFKEKQFHQGLFKENWQLQSQEGDWENNEFQDEEQEPLEKENNQERSQLTPYSSAFSSMKFHSLTGQNKNSFSNSNKTDQQYDQEYLLGLLENVKAQERKACEDQSTQAQTSESLQMKIKELKFSLDKMKREMKVFEKESLITDRHFENLTERDIVAHKKNVKANIVKLCVGNFKKEVQLDRSQSSALLNSKQAERNQANETTKDEQAEYAYLLVKIDKANEQITSQEEKIKQLENDESQQNLRLIDCKNTLSQLETLIELYKMVVGGELEKKDKENQDKDKDQNNYNDSHDDNKSNNWILPGSSQRSIPRIDGLGTSKSLSLLTTSAVQGVVKFKRLPVEIHRSQVEIEAERTEILSKIEQLYTFNGLEPHSIVDQVLSLYAHQNLQLQSMQAQFESLAGQKSTNLVMISDLISQINLTFGLDTPEDGDNGHNTNNNITNDSSNITNIHLKPSLPSNSTNPDIIKILSGYPVSMETIKNALETEERECNKLQRGMLEKISLQSRFFLNLVEVLFRYNSLLKHTMQQYQSINGIVADKQLLDFSDEFSRFICTFRLGMFAKRGLPIDKARQVQEAYQNVPVIGPRTPVTSGTTKSKDGSPLNIKQVNFVFSDAVKESYRQSQQQSMQMLEDINKNEIDKFKEKMNFIPFSKQELDRIYKVVFTDASEYFLDEWYTAIKGSIIQIYMTEEDLLKYLRETKEITEQKEKGQEECMHQTDKNAINKNNTQGNLNSQERLMAASISEIQQLSTAAFALHFKNIMTIFDKYEAFTSTIQLKIAALTQSDETTNSLKNQSIDKLQSLLIQDKPQTAAQKAYVNAVTAKRQQYLNYQGDMADPITEKKRITLRDLKVNANEKASTDDVKKLIFKMASSQRNRSNQTYKEIKQNGGDVFAGGFKQNQQQDEFNLLDPSIQIQLKQQNMTEQEFLQSERDREKKEIELNARNRSLELQREQDLLMIQQKKLAIGQGLHGQQTDRITNSKKNQRFYKQEDKSQHRIYAEMIEHNNLIKQLTHLERQKEHIDNRSVFMKLNSRSPKNLNDYSIGYSTLFVTPRNNQTNITNQSQTQFLPFSSSSTTTSKINTQHQQLSYRQGVFAATPMINRRNSSLKGQFNSNTKRSVGVFSMNSTADLVTINNYQQQILPEGDQQQQQQPFKQIQQQQYKKNNNGSQSSKNLMKIIAVEQSPSIIRSNSNNNSNQNKSDSKMNYSVRLTKTANKKIFKEQSRESSSDLQQQKTINQNNNNNNSPTMKIIQQKNNPGKHIVGKNQSKYRQASEIKSNRDQMSPPTSWLQYTSTSNMSNTSRQRMLFDNNNNNNNSVLFTEKSIYPSCIVDRLRDGERTYETQSQLYHNINNDFITVDQLLL